MNSTIKLLHKRHSVRKYSEQKISDPIKNQIIEAAIRAPTAGNMMLYSIIEVTDQQKKDCLAITCDNQPFIAKAPLLLLFLADYQRMNDLFATYGLIAEHKNNRQKPQAGDLVLGICDALLAAQNAVVAAESLGLGSCYIGDILENYEEHQKMFQLPPYVFPITLLCLGYSAEENTQTRSRLKQKYIHFNDQYQRFKKEDFEDMYSHQAEYLKGQPKYQNMAELYYHAKFNAEYSKEMNRSVEMMLSKWL
ncbi:MAG: nitroreductase family protein [Spirochaetes bacterium]|nr:nitroreductase family protein [Spirochaetota bacterium]